MNEAETRAEHIESVLDKLKPTLRHPDFSGQLTARSGTDEVIE